jgi:WD40 repeat protein
VRAQRRAGAQAHQRTDRRREFAAHTNRILSIAFSPRGERIVTASRDCSARVLDRQGRLVAKLPHEKTVAAAAFSPDGRRIATACADGYARVFASDGALELRLTGERAGGERAMVWCLAFDASGEYVATGSYDGVARVWPITCDGLLAVATRLDPRGEHDSATARDGGAREAAARRVRSPLSRLIQGAPRLTLRGPEPPPSPDRHWSRNA